MAAYPGVVVLDRDYGHRRPGSHAPSSSSPAHARDRRPDDHRMHDSLPHRARSLSHHAIQLDHLRRRPSAATVPAAPRHVPSSWSETAPSPFSAVTMPVITRSSTVAYRRPDDYQYSRDGAGGRDRDPYVGAYAHVPAPPSHSHSQSHSHRRDIAGDSGSYPADASYPPGPRRSQRRRQPSPLSARHYRSTPDTTRSSRTSVCESDGFSAITADTQDERPKLPRAPELKHVRGEVDDDEDDDDDEGEDEVERHPFGPKILQHIRQDSPERRGMRRITMRPTSDDDHLKESSSSENEMVPGPLVRRWTDHRPPPLPHDTRQYSRHSSRHRSELLDSGSSVRAGPPRRSQSAVDEPRQTRTLESRLSRKQRDTEVVYDETPRPPPVRRSSTTAGPRVESRSPSSSRRRSSLIGSFLGPMAQPKASERSDKHEKPGKQLQCVICLDDCAKTAKLKCGHRMCSMCLKTVFKRSIKEPGEMPPKCCSHDIPLKFVDPLFNKTFKKTWNSKLVEFSTRNRIYCPYKRCGAWIKPDSVYRADDGRKCAKCGECKMKVCCSCNGKWHSSRKCPKDEETNRFLEQAKEAGWQQCYKCKEMVELKEGCNHMTCRCGGQFCMICGSKWKSCECPWFNYETPDDEDDDPALQTPSRLERAVLERRDSQLAASKGVARGIYESGVVPNAVRQRAMSYDEEMVMRRLQERQDGDASRRRRQKDPKDDHGSNSHQHHHHAQHRRHPEVEIEVEENDEGDRDAYGRLRTGGRPSVGSATGRRMSDEFRRGPQHIVMPPSPPPAAVHMPPPAFDAGPREPMPGDYLADVGRARGAAYRQDSTERRLAERFSEARVSLRDRAPELSGNPMVGSPPSAAAAAAAAAMVSPRAPLQGLGLHMPPGPMTAMQSRMGGPPPPLPPMPPMGDAGYAFAPPRLMRATMSDPSGMVTGREREREPRREDATRGIRREAPPQARPSMMAGLSGPGSGMNRVHEWRNHVEPGGPKAGP